MSNKKELNIYSFAKLFLEKKNNENYAFISTYIRNISTFLWNVWRYPIVIYITSQCCNEDWKWTKDEDEESSDLENRPKTKTLRNFEKSSKYFRFSLFQFLLFWFSLFWFSLLVSAFPVFTFPVSAFLVSAFWVSTFWVSIFPVSTFWVSTFPVSTFWVLVSGFHFLGFWFPVFQFPLFRFPLLCFCLFCLRLPLFWFLLWV